MQLVKLKNTENLKFDIIGKGIAADIPFQSLKSDSFPELLIYHFDNLKNEYYGFRVDEIAQTILRKVLTLIDSKESQEDQV